MVGLLTRSAEQHVQCIAHVLAQLGKTLPTIRRRPPVTAVQRMNESQLFSATSADNAFRRASSRVWSNEVCSTRPPTPLSLSRTLSPVTFLTRTKSTASPDLRSC